jgi:S1-C subfamily serine protease
MLLKEGVMKYFSGLLLMLTMLVIGGGCCTNLHDVAPKNISENERSIRLVEHIENATVTLLVGSEGNKVAYCSGVWIVDRHILTANHCAEVIGRMIAGAPEDIEYNSRGDIVVFANRSDLDEAGEIPSGVGWLGLVEDVDREHDLATISVLGKTSFHTIALMTEEKIRTGDIVHVFGHTAGFVWTYAKGVVAATRNMQGPIMGNDIVKSKVLQVSAPIWVGNSGGGAFDSDGRLIGICSWVTLKAPNVSFFIHRDEIRRFLEKNKNKK